MKKLLTGGLLALGCWTGSAQAATTFTTTFDTTGALAAGTQIYQDFSGYTAGASIGANAFAYGASSGPAVRPPVGRPNNFGAVQANGSYTTSFFTPSNVFSFVLGSLDSYNTLVLTSADGTITTLNGSSIIGGLSATGNPSGTVTYRVTAGSLFSSATFLSNGNNSFEFDNLAAAVPEPAAWGMMILGFGLVGGVMRRRSAAKVNFAY